MGPWILLSGLITSARAALAGRGAGALITGATLADLLNLDILRQWAVKIGPRSDPEALEQWARMVMSMTGADGTKVIGPDDPKDWNYFTFSVNGQRAWWHKQYNSFKSKRASFQAGMKRGTAAGKREIAQISQAQRG